ncbi:MAG: hypothetical protein HY706_10320 [Candidatus Hydrogenedentes bacterium]|nr:hypothetical protein [Candidatus Hydrogenedentota bacterium]
MITAQQLHLFNGLYLVVLVVVAVLTRATARRIAGALAGAATMFVVGLPIVPLGEHVGWWRFAIPWEPNFLTALGINAVLCSFVFLITWRVARRFGGRGLAVLAVVAAVMGPIRDKGFVERFPEWGSFAPGVAPVLAISASYVLAGVVGHGVMRLVAGPARGSPLARRPWEAAEPSATDDPARHVAFGDFKAPRGGPGS